MIPFEPESIESMQARFSKCLEKVWIATEGMEDRPGLHREYLFDFTGGLRLLISRDKLTPKSKTLIHVSASWENEQPMSLDLVTIAITVAYKVLGGQGYLELLGVSAKGIPHWVVVDDFNKSST